MWSYLLSSIFELTLLCWGALLALKILLHPFEVLLSLHHLVVIVLIVVVFLVIIFILFWCLKVSRLLPRFDGGWFRRPLARCNLVLLGSLCWGIVLIWIVIVRLLLAYDLLLYLCFLFVSFNLSCLLLHRRLCLCLTGGVARSDWLFG